MATRLTGKWKDKSGAQVAQLPKCVHGREGRHDSEMAGSDDVKPSLLRCYLKIDKATTTEHNPAQVLGQACPSVARYLIFVRALKLQ